MRLAPWAIVLLGVSLAIAACWQALNAPFFLDDNFYVFDNVKLQALHPADLYKLFLEPYNSYEFLPLRDLSYWLDMRLFGLAPYELRLHNMLLYLMGCLLVYTTTLSLWRYFTPGATDAPWAAAAVATLFALHPAHVETLVWASCRKDVLSGLFALLALWLAVGARRAQGLAPRRASATLAALLAAILCKATMVVMAPVIGLLWIIFWRDIPAIARPRAMLLWPLACMLLAACLAAIFMGHSSVKLPVYFGAEAYPRTLAILGWMARLALTPESRHYLYPVYEGAGLGGMVALGAMTLLAGIAGVAMLRKRSLAGFALAIFALLCLPYTQILPYSTDSLVTDRSLYLALWPILLLLVALGWQLKRVPRLLLLLAVALPWIYQTVERPNDWRGMDTVFDADIRAYPGFYFPLCRKVFWLHDTGNASARDEKLADAIADPQIRNIMIQFVRADHALNAAASAADLHETISRLLAWDALLQKLPEQAKWNTPLTVAYAKFREELKGLWIALAQKFPDDAGVRYQAGLGMLKAGDFERAASELQAAVGSPQLAGALRGSAFKSLGIALLDGGHFVQAEAPLQAALTQTPPDSESYCVLAELYRHTGRPTEALQAEFNCRFHGAAKQQ
jgi:hypothetical protein